MVGRAWSCGGGVPVKTEACSLVQCRVGVRMSSAWNGVITYSYKELPGLCSLSVS